MGAPPSPAATAVTQAHRVHASTVTATTTLRDEGIACHCEPETKATSTRSCQVDLRKSALRSSVRPEHGPGMWPSRKQSATDCGCSKPNGKLQTFIAWNPNFHQSQFTIVRFARLHLSQITCQGLVRGLGQVVPLTACAIVPVDQPSVHWRSASPSLARVSRHANSFHTT
jgi:hypothetical protein